MKDVPPGEDKSFPRNQNKMKEKLFTYIIDLENEDELAESESRETHGDRKGRFHENKVN